MWSGIFNLGIGAVMVIGGLTQGWTLIGTSSSYALVGVGGGIAVLGIYQLIKSRKD